MTPTKIDNPVIIFKAPFDWNEEKDGPCGDLPVARVGDYFVSHWLPDPDELKALNEGRPPILWRR